MEAWEGFDRELGRPRLERGIGQDEAMTSRSWTELSARAGRNEKPGLLVAAIGSGALTDPAQLRIAVEDTSSLHRESRDRRPASIGLTLARAWRA